MMPSAGNVSPLVTTARSPGTTSVAGMSMGIPSRITLARSAKRLFSPSVDACVRRWRKTSINTSGPIATRSVIASTTCPTVAYRAPVAAKNQIIGSFAVSLASPHQGWVDTSTTSLRPYACAPSAASAAVRPPTFHWPAKRSSGMARFGIYAPSKWRAGPLRDEGLTDWPRELDRSPA